MAAIVCRGIVCAVVVPRPVNTVVRFAAVLEALKHRPARTGVDRADAAPPALIPEPERIVQRIELSGEQQAGLCRPETRQRFGRRARVVFTEIDETAVGAWRDDRIREAPAGHQ